MRTTTIICDHCGGELDEFRMFVATDAFGTPVQIDLHVDCLAEVAEFCTKLPHLVKS